MSLKSIITSHPKHPSKSKRVQSLVRFIGRFMTDLAAEDRAVQRPASMSSGAEAA